MTDRRREAEGGRGKGKRKRHFLQVKKEVEKTHISYSCIIGE